MIRVLRFLLLSLAVLPAWFLSGCATSPYEGDGKRASDLALLAQMQHAEKVHQNRFGGRLIYAGFAMHSQSKAFRADIEAMEQLVRKIDPEPVVFKLANPAWGQVADLPFATRENIAVILSKMAGLARPHDKVVVLIATHGGVNQLEVNFNDSSYPAIDARGLNMMLAPLRGRSTLLLLSACFSGSFLDTVSGPSRIVLTAAAHNRASFGCNFHSNNTFFVDAFVNQDLDLSRSVVERMAAAKTAIDQREKAMKLSPGSEPQIRVGGAVASWSQQPLKHWLSTP